MTIKEVIIRLKLPVGNFWKKFQKACVLLATVIPGASKLSEYIGILPEGFVPDWVKALVGGMIIMGILLPQLTVANQEELKKHLEK